MWDATCPGIILLSMAAGKVASVAKEKKACKYAMLGQVYCFVPVAIEILGAFGTLLGRRII